MTTKTINTIQVMRDMTNWVKKDEKKTYLAKFITGLVKRGVDITELMGKPLSNFDYNAIYLQIQEWEEEEKQNTDYENQIH